MNDRPRHIAIGQRVHWLILTLACGFVVYFFRDLLSPELIASEDLPEHVALTERLREQLLSGRIVFYDASQFTGFAAFAFYGFLFSLLAALLSFPFELFTESPVVFSTQVVALGLLAFIPVGMFRLAQSLLTNTKELPVKGRAFGSLALYVSALSVWFLLHDAQFYGIGAGAYLLVGLAPQLLGLCLLLEACTAILRTQAAQEAHSKPWQLPVLVCLLLWTHVMTAAFFFGFCILWLLLAPRGALAVLRSIMLGVALSAIWFLPFISYSADFLLPDPYPPQGDVLALLFRYPLHALIRALGKDGLTIVRSIQLFPFIFAVVLLSCFSLVLRNRNPQLSRWCLALLLISFITSSSYVAASLPLGFHYYRFHAYCIFLLLPCIAAATTFHEARCTSVIIRSIPPLGYLIATASVVALPALEFDRARLTTQQYPQSTYKQLLDALAGDEPEAHGRVFVEYLNDYERFPYLSSHILEAKIPGVLQREVTGGLLVESAIRSRFIAVPASLLGAQVFSPYLIFSKDYQGDTIELLQQLRSFGVTTIIAGSTRFIATLRSVIGDADLVVGPYHVFNLKGTLPPMITQITKPMIGYYDPNSRLPWYFLSFYFAARREISQQLELVTLEDISTAKGISTILSTAHDKSFRLSENTSVLPFQIEMSTFSHYQTDYTIARSIPRYRALARILDAQGETWGKLAQQRGTVSREPSPETTPTLDWNSKTQSFDLDGLIPGAFYSVNYSFTPFLSCHSCVLYRGSTNQIVIRADEPTAQITFRYFSATASILGALISLVATCTLLILTFRRGIANNSGNEQ